MQDILKRINNGFDGIIRNIGVVNFKQATIEVSCYNNKTKEWININFQFDNIKEINIFQKLNTSSQILSDGINFGEIEGFYYLDFNPYLDLGSENTISDIRKSDVYIISEKIGYTIKNYSDFS